MLTKLLKHNKQGTYNAIWKNTISLTGTDRVVSSMVVWIKAAEGKLGLAYGGIKRQTYFQQGSFPVYLKPF